MRLPCYRAPLMESLTNLRVILGSRPSRTINEQELFMQLSPIYLEKIAAAEQHGEQRGEQRGEQETRIKIALKMIGEQVPLETIARLTELSIEQIQELQSQQG
jgi:predicted transposase/invertase (TIGR01784 family)